MAGIVAAVQRRSFDQDQVELTTAAMRLTDEVVFHLHPESRTTRSVHRGPFSFDNRWVGLQSPVRADLHWPNISTMAANNYRAQPSLTVAACADETSHDLPNKLICMLCLESQWISREGPWRDYLGDVQDYDFTSHGAILCPRLSKLQDQRSSVGIGDRCLPGPSCVRSP